MSYSIHFKNPIILPKNSNFLSLVIRHLHLLTGYGGKSCLKCGFFIISGVSLKKSIIFKCVGCRRVRAKQCTQKMSDLPVDRLAQTAPFENVGCDFLAPFKSKFDALL